MKYDKLVRDRIPEVIRERGGTPIIHIAQHEEYRIKLQEKLQEEVKEFIQDGHDEELADIVEVVYAICEYRGIDREQLETLRKEKLKKRGGFSGRIILDEA